MQLDASEARVADLLQVKLDLQRQMDRLSREAAHQAAQLRARVAEAEGAARAARDTAGSQRAEQEARSAADARAALESKTVALEHALAELEGLRAALVRPGPQGAAGDGNAVRNKAGQMAPTVRDDRDREIAALRQRVAELEVRRRTWGVYGPAPVPRSLGRTCKHLLPPVCRRRRGRRSARLARAATLPQCRPCRGTCRVPGGRRHSA